MLQVGGSTRSTAQVVVFTSAYPSHQGEVSFLQAEIPRLAERFRRVVLVPEHAAPPYLDLPSGVELDLSYAEHASTRSSRETVHLALTDAEPLRELVEAPAVVLSPSRLRVLLSFLARAKRTQRWAREFVAQQPDSTILFYTYWMDQATYGLCLAKAGLPPSKSRTIVVSRAHRYDLYAEQRRPSYLPCRRRLLRLLDRIFVVSQHGRAYLVASCPEARDKIEIARLGVPATPITAASSDGCFRILSCSHLVEAKRVDLLFEGLASLARTVPKRPFEWTHFGSGPLESSLRDQVRLAPDNLEVRLMGRQSNDALMDWYRQRPVDLFVNVSSSEGVPVALMEAHGHGVLTLATAVGGTPEIVTPQNGTLLPAQCSPTEIAAAAWELLVNPRRRALARSAQEECRRSYGDRNFSRFADRLVALASLEEPAPAHPA
jgi:colanic acid/amylovoran biosynthesis glycosyltransferase